MSSAMKAAIHLGPNYTKNLEVYKNTNFEEIQSLFGITQKLISDHSEDILNVKRIESTTLFNAWGSCQILQKQTEDGKAKWQISNCPLLPKNSWESMENQLSSSGIFSQDLRHCRFFRGSRMMCTNGI